MSAGPLVVTYPLTGRSRAIVAEELSGTAEAIYLVDLAPADRAHALRRAGAVLSHDTSKELRPDEILLIRNARLLQFTAAGVDWVPTRDLPQELPVAANKGGGAEPMSEHIVALALAAAKRLFIEHANLKRGEFNQSSANRMLRGGVCGILGFGNVALRRLRQRDRELRAPLTSLFTRSRAHRPSGLWNPAGKSVRNRLAAGGNRIRTRGPSAKGIPGRLATRKPATSQRCNTEVRLTHRWRKTDSNSRSLREGKGYGEPLQASIAVSGLNL
jgi:hypothetical protein